MSATSEVSQALNNYAYFWSIGDLPRASAALDTALRQRPENLELWWYRLCALEKLGRAEAALSEMETAERARAARKIRPPHRPGEKGAQVIAGLPGREAGPPTLFALTLNSASAKLCRLFLERLGPVRMAALCRRLAELDPASAPGLMSRAQGYLAETKARLDEALTDLKEAYLASPAIPGHLVKIAGLLQGYEDGFEAWGQLSGLVASGRTGPQLAAFIEEAFKDVKEKSRRGPKSDFDGLCLALATIAEALRAGWPLGRACQEFFGFDPRDRNDGTASLSGISKAGLDFVNNLKMLGVARKIFLLSHQRPTPLRPVAADDQTADNRRFIQQLEKKFLPLGYSFVGLFEMDNLNESLDLRVTPGVFISPCRRSYVLAFVVRPKWSNRLEWLIGALIGLARIKVIRTASTLSDGRVLGLMRAAAPNHFEQSPLYQTARASTLTSPGRLVQRHDEMLRKYQTENPGVACRTMDSLADIEAALHHEARIDNEFRLALPDLVKPVELRRMLKFNYEEWSPKVLAHLRRLDQIYQRPKWGQAPPQDDATGAVRPGTDLNSYSAKTPAEPIS